MKDVRVLDCFKAERGALERVNYFPRQILTVDDMVTERDYFLQKLRRHNRFLHGWGVVCGLEVAARPIPEDMPWRVQISAGYALGPYGDEIYVAEPVFLDLAKCGPGAATDPCEPSLLRSGSGTGTTLYIAIKYAECLARPVRAMPAGCACEEEACEYSRIRDSFPIECLTELPSSHKSHDGPTLCELIKSRVIPCPPCPTDPWIVLAQVMLPVGENSAIGIKNDIRRLVFSTAVLQQQLIECCCKELLKVISVQIFSDYENEQRVIATMEDPTKPLSVSQSEHPNVIQVKFSRPVDFDTIRDGETFVVTAPSREKVSGEIFRIPDTTVRWKDWEGFLYQDTGKCTVMLVGTGSSPITSTDGQPLDGEPTQLPSGNDQAGGDFSFILSITE